MVKVSVEGRKADTARQLDRDLQQFRVDAKPMTAGIVGLVGRRSMRHRLRELTACDRYARTLARSSDRCLDASPQLVDAVKSAAAQIRRNIDVLVTAMEFDHPTTVFPATDFLDAADSLARNDGRRLQAALHSLRQIDRVVINAAIDLGADNGVLLKGEASNIDA